MAWLILGLIVALGIYGHKTYGAVTEGWPFFVIIILCLVLGRVLVVGGGSVYEDTNCVRYSHNVNSCD